MLLTFLLHLLLSFPFLSLPIFFYSILSYTILSYSLLSYPLISSPVSLLSFRFPDIFQPATRKQASTKSNNAQIGDSLTPKQHRQFRNLSLRTEAKKKKERHKFFLFHFSPMIHFKYLKNFLFLAQNQFHIFFCLAIALFVYIILMLGEKNLLFFLLRYDNIFDKSFSAERNKKVLRE